MTVNLGLELIKAERRRQIEGEGWTHGHDAKHLPSTLALAAQCYLDAHGEDAPCPDKWPFAHGWWKPKARIKNLIRAGALFLAAAERAESTGACGYGQALRLRANYISEEINELGRPPEGASPLNHDPGDFPINWNVDNLPDFVQQNYWVNPEDAIGDIRLFLAKTKVV